MANEREVFTVLESANKDGIAWQGQAEGNAISGINLAPAVVAKDKDDQFVLLPVEIAGEDPGNAVPVLGAKDSAGKLAYLNLNADGELIVSTASLGTAKTAEDSVLGVIDTATEVCKISITASKVLEEIEVMASCSYACLWEMIWNNASAETRLASFMTGPGQFSFSKEFKNLIVTAGTGTQELILKGTQLQGKVSDLNGFLGAFEKA